MSNKHNLVLYVNKDLVEKSRSLGFNLSKTFENHLKHLLMQFSTVNASNNIRNNGNVGDWWAGPDLTPYGFESNIPWIAPQLSIAPISQVFLSAFLVLSILLNQKLHLTHGNSHR